jgi:hypothetical protein
MLRYGINDHADESSVRSEIFVESKPDKFLSSVRSDIE